jgi:dipeptidyl aminopeptidase/acylaminoacyl peptidase
MKRLLLVVLVFTLYVPFAAPQPNAAAQTKARLLDKETFMDMESVSNPEISPDGTQIVFTRTWVDKVKDQYRSNLWIVDVAGTRVRELTSGSYSDSAPVWSPSFRIVTVRRNCTCSGSTPKRSRSSRTSNAPPATSSGRRMANGWPSRHSFPTTNRS